MSTTQFLTYTIIFLLAAVVVVPLSRRLGFGVVLGYLVAGLIIGPHGLRLIYDAEGILHFAELGVVFMLFVIGLELKPSRLWVMRKSVFGLGTLYMLSASLVLLPILFYFMGVGKPALLSAVFLGLSSTAFDVQNMAERNELNTEFGRGAFSILLFQDLLTIPLLALLPSLSQVQSQVQSPPWYFAIGVILGIIILGRYLSRPLFRIVAQSRSRDVFTAFTLLIVIIVAVIMSYVGLSMALGSFLAGVLLADSEYRHELETNIEPFKGLLLGLFFMAVGMSMNTSLIFEKSGEVFAIVTGLVALKLVGGFVAARIFGFEGEPARRLTLILAQGSEFGFVLFAQAQNFLLVEKLVSETLILAISLSLVISPFLFIFYDRVLNSRFLKTKPKEFDRIQGGDAPVILAGLGRFGQIVGRILRAKDINFTALEHDPEQVEVLRRFGSQVYYGDASRLDLLEMAGAAKAKLFVLAIDDIDSSVKVAEMVTQHFPNLKILARARNRLHYFRLKDLGIEIIERELFWSSLKVAQAALKNLGFKDDEIARSADTFTQHDFKTIEEQYKKYTDVDHLAAVAKESAQQLADTLKRDDTTGN